LSVVAVYVPLGLAAVIGPTIWIFSLGNGTVDVVPGRTSVACPENFTVCLV
jgi:hypothetical protein